MYQRKLGQLNFVKRKLMLKQDKFQIRKCMIHKLFKFYVNRRHET